MKQTKELKEIRNRGIVYAAGNKSLEMISNIDYVKNDQKLLHACIVGRGIFSMLSLFNFCRSLEKFDDYEEGDENKFWYSYLAYFIVPTAFNIYSITREIRTIRMKNRTGQIDRTIT